MKCHAKGFVAVAQIASLLKWVEWVSLKLCGPHQIPGIRHKSGSADRTKEGKAIIIGENGGTLAF